MAPNLEAIKNRFHRIRRHHKNQDSIASSSGSSSSGNDKKPSQPPNQIQASAAGTSRSAGPAQPKKVSGIISPQLPPTMLSKQGSSLSQSSKPPFVAGNTPAYSSTSYYTSVLSSASSASSISSTSAVAKFGTAGSSRRMVPVEKSPISYNQANSHSLGSQSNPIDLTGDAPLNTIHCPSPAGLNLPAVKHSMQPLSAPKNLASTEPPKYPATSSTQMAQPGPSWHSDEDAPGNFGVLQFASDLALVPKEWINSWSVPTEFVGSSWLDAASSFSSHAPWLGNTNHQDALAHGAHAQHVASSWESPPVLPPRPEQGPKADDALVEIGSSGASNESLADLERLAQDAAHVEAALEKLEPLQHFVEDCHRVACASCTRKTAMDSKSIVKMTTGWIGTNGKLALGLRCSGPLCQQSICLGCGSPISCQPGKGPSSILSISGKRLKVYWCCPRGRLAAIWALACGWEAPVSGSRTVSCVVSKVRGRTAGKAVASYSASPLSHSSANAKGVGYSSEHTEYFPFTYFSTRPRAPAPPTPKKPIDTHGDLVKETYFRLLALLLPSYKWGSYLDIETPPFVPHMLSRSPVIELAATMLSNDSIDEISRQHQLYDGMLEFFDALGRHPATAGLAYGDRNLYHAKGGSLLDVSFAPRKGKDNGNDRIVVKDTGKSMIALLGKLAAQSQTVLRHSRANPNEFKTQEGRNLLALSERLSRVSTSHISNRQRIRTEMDIVESHQNINFSEWHHDQCVKDTADEDIASDFSYRREAERAVTATPVRGRMKRLITELSTLQTSLPEGIFVRHGSSRLDMMKVLIIGPKHTPYEHGLFEFDLYCPPDYPNSPPRMRFMTTNGGRTRFNPNLYEDGKICLSLLGTWSGEPWRADQSTILQVLVSIQSLVLCEQPWYNEPGREESENKAQSAKYSNDVRSWTLQYAVLPWIDSIDVNNTSQEAATNTSATSLWQETARLYLRANARDIIHSSKQASSKSETYALQNAAKVVEIALLAKGYSI
ncbi:hypothetical protein F4677DRAFT_65243 [Hypoxylon crocopeplum]|nr:hypothetical protein F4677DRAFT_65243 [Hypoxylon crocopeplum]